MRNKQDKEWYKNYYEKNKEKILERKRVYHIENRDAILVKHKTYAKKNKNKISEYQKKYNTEHKEQKSEYHKEHYKLNKDRKILYRNAYVEKNKEAVLLKQRECNKKWFQINKQLVYERRNKRYKENAQTKIAELLRKRFKHIVKARYKSKGALELLGCSLEFFKEYISKQFKEGMSWDNHSKTTWHIDHIKPCASFDLKDIEQQKKCFHYTNLQPLEAKLNMSKGKKLWSLQ